MRRRGGKGQTEGQAAWWGLLRSGCLVMVLTDCVRGSDVARGLCC